MNKRFHSFNEAGEFAKALAIAGRKGVTVKRQGDGFVVVTNDNEEPPKSNPYRDIAGRVWEDLEQRDKIQSDGPLDHQEERRMIDEANKRSENIRQLHEPCYICSGTGSTVNGGRCKKCTGRGFL